MKLLTPGCWLLLLACWLVSGSAQAQCALPNPADCNGVPFQSYLSNPSAPNGLGTEVQAFCVGQAVTFAPCASRAIRIDNDAFYGVLPGAGTTFPSCLVPRTGQTSVRPPFTFRFIYTPQAGDVGLVTVSESTNENSVPKYYTRTFRVYATPAPVFTVAPCPNGLALVTVTDVTYDSYLAQAAGGPTVPVLRNQATAVPAAAGAAVTVTGRYNPPATCTNSATQTPAALAAPQTPLFTRLTLQGPLPGGSATLDVGQLPPGYTYTLQVADGAAPGGFRNVAAVPSGSSSVALATPAAGCYRLTRADVCGGSFAATPLICTLSLRGASAQNRNQLLLADAGAGTSYTVTRDGRPLTSFTSIAGGLEDADVQCGTTYTYRVTATQPGGGVAVSNAVAITTLSALPPRQPQLVASFNLNNVVVLTPLLAAPLTGGSRLRYRRRSGSQAPTDLPAVDATGRQARDSTALAELRASPPCYSVGLTDVCGNASPESSDACPTLLTAAPLDPDGRTATLSWSVFVGPDPSQPATYVMQRLAADGAVLSAVPVSGLRFDDLLAPTGRQVLRYRLRVAGAGLPAGTFSYSNLATVTRQPRLTIPNAFTPNGDGLNDRLEVKGLYLRDYTFVVVDRNGQEVFRGTNRLETWDGGIRGRVPVLGAYVWRFQQDNEDGTSFSVTGSVTILK